MSLLTQVLNFNSKIMKNLWIIAFLAILVSCNKAELTAPNSANEEVLNAQLPKNKKLLEDFVNGTLPIGANASYRSGGSYEVSKYGDMLHFPTEQDLENYILAADYVVENWDYTDSDIHDDTPQEVNHLGNPALNAIDAIHNFSSLRYKYLTDEYEYGPDYGEYLEFEVRDPDMRMVLNNVAEIRVGDRIIKYLRNHKIGIVHNLNQNALDELRENSVLASYTDLEFFNIQTDRFYTPTVPPSSPPTGGGNGSYICNFIKTKDITLEIGGDYKTIQLELLAYGSWSHTSQPGTGNCNYTVEVTDWGDGTSTNFGIGGGTETHTYSLNLSPGNSHTYTIEVEAIKLTAGNGCDLCPAISNWTIDVTVVNPIPGCNDKDKPRNKNHDFTHNNKDYRMKMIIGQQPETSFWSFNWNEKVWAETIFYRKVNGSYKRRKPPYGIIAELDGFYYENCTDEKTLSQSSGNKRRKSVKVQNRIKKAFGTIETSGHPKQFKSNHKAEVGNNLFESVNGFVLFP